MKYIPQSHTPKALKNGGFTLLELLIAMLLTSIIGVVLFSTYRMVLENGQSLQHIVGERETGRMVKTIIDNDIAGLYDMSEKAVPPLSKKPIIASDEYYALTGTSPKQSEDTLLISFTSTHSLNKVIETPTPPPVCLEYVLRKTKINNALIRRERAYCGVDGAFQWTEMLLLQGLDSVEFALLFGTEFRTEWSPTFPKDPTAVRFVFKHAGKEKLETFIVPIIAQRLEVDAI